MGPSLSSRPPAFAVLALALAGCRGGCRARQEEEAAQARLALVPAEARILASVDLARVRASPVWQRLAELAQDDPADARALAEVTARTGLDPLRQVHRILAAFPEDARRTGQFALLVEGTGFDERRLVAYAREQAGGKIERRSAGGRTVWAGTGPGRRVGFFLDGGRFALGAGGWGERMAALAAGAPGGSAARGELARLLARVDTGSAIWFAAIVPPDLRQSLRGDPRYQAAASVNRLAASADLGPGLTAQLVAELSNAEDARALVARVQATVKEAKRNARVLMLGLGPYLDGLSGEAQGATVRLRLVLPEAQVGELLARLVAVVRLARGKPAAPAAPPKMK